ncbi:hypothetical protein ACROYT_G034566 [Oculina patagonica]
MDFFTKADLNVEKHYKESYGSVENLITLAKNGNITAQGDLGMAYAEGVEDFVTKDSEKAIGWLNSAVENGYVLPFILAKLGELLDRKGTPHYQQKAYEMYHRAAKMGSTEAQLNLAEMYRCGVEEVVNEDIKEAFEWYKKAADESTVGDNTELGAIGRLFAGTMKKMGNALGSARQKALVLLYKYYLKGDCPEGRPQPTKAVYYLTRAAELGDTEAQLKLGQIYLTGSCEQIKDVRKARRWLEKASAGGDVMAKQLLQQCKQNDDAQHDASEVSEEAFTQSFAIMGEKLKQRTEAKVHPFAISQPVAFSEEILSQFNWSPTARIYLQAYKLVKEGLEILYKSNFTDERGISLIAHGYLTENSILQAFPQIQHFLLPNILQLCEKNLFKNPCFFEGFFLSFALRGYESAGKFSVEKNSKGDSKTLMALKNLIHFIQKAEPNSPPSEDPFEFDKNYSSWLHVLYYHMAAIYTIAEATEEAAEAFENSLECCPSYHDAKRGLGYNLLILCCSKKRKGRPNIPTELRSHNKQRPRDREMSKYDSWTAEKLRDTTKKLLQEYLVEAPRCEKNYPNACYYLAFALLDENVNEFRKYYELGQDAEEKRLPFFNPVDLPIKDMISPFYQLYANVRKPVECGNKACIKKVKESDLKSCGRCGKQKYCSKDCQQADWKNHKLTCTAPKGPKKKTGRT